MQDDSTREADAFSDTSASRSTADTALTNDPISIDDPAPTIDTSVTVDTSATRLEVTGDVEADGDMATQVSGVPVVLGPDGLPRKRRRRGSRGGRGRSRPKNPAGQDGSGEVEGAESGELAGGEDYHDARADRGLTAEDLAADAAEDAGVSLSAQPTPMRPRIGDTLRVPTPIVQPEEPPAVQQSKRNLAPAAGRSTATGGTATGSATTGDAARASGGEDAETGTQPAKRRRRRGGRGRRGSGGGGGGGTGSPTTGERAAKAGNGAMSRSHEAEHQADAERVLDELDAEVLERRKGKTRKGRPTGRYLMCVHSRPGVATQIAVLEGRSLVELYVNRPEDAATAIDGNIYLGRVQNVLPGMEAAFLDIGTPKNGVLYRGDVSYDESEVEGDHPRIERLLHNGQSAIVQVTKNPIGAKGARLTQEVSLAGRFLVMVPGEPDTYGISKRLPDDERKRLRKVLDEIRPSDSGLIVRTAAEGATPDELSRDLRRLQGQWDKISSLANGAKPPLLLHQEPDLTLRVIREEFNKEYREIVIDDRALYEEVRDYVAAITPELANRVIHYDDALPIFERYHVHEQLHKALDRKVWLPSGGSLIIERTEALTVVDVNTGKNVGKSNLEETVYRNNLEAAEEVARQLRLRDIGGIIVIDFIDMEIKRNRDDVLRTFKEALARDKTRTQVFDISELGLVEMTRKRVSEGLVESFSGRCDTCEGRGIVLDESLL